MSTEDKNNDVIDLAKVRERQNTDKRTEHGSNSCRNFLHQFDPSAVFGYATFEKPDFLQDYQFTALMNSPIVALTEFVMPFYQMNDAGHSIDHALEVVTTASYLVTKYIELGLIHKSDVERSLAIITVAGLTHDMFSSIHRREHHYLAKEFILKNKNTYPFTLWSETVLEIAADAAESHRASWRGKYAGVYSEIIAMADRGSPDADVGIMRSMIFGYETKKLEFNEAVLYGINRTASIFGSKRNYRVPKIYFEIYAEELAKREAILQIASNCNLDASSAVEFLEANKDILPKSYNWVQEQLKAGVKQPAEAE